MPNTHRLASIFFGLWISLWFGTLALWLVNPQRFVWGIPDASTVGAGVFTYLIGTGLYYLAGYGFSGKIEIAAQFTKIKPILSTLFGILFFHESLKADLGVALVLVGGGVGLLYLYSLRKAFHIGAFILGLATAISWSVGEVLAKIAWPNGIQISDTFLALISAALLSSLGLPWIISKREVFSKALAYGPFFAVHGILSYALAYSLFFHSIGLLGLGRTALINAFWPFLSLFLAYFFNRMAGRREKLEPLVVGAGLLMLGGSLTLIITSGLA